MKIYAALYIFNLSSAFKSSTGFKWRALWWKRAAFLLKLIPVFLPKASEPYGQLQNLIPVICAVPRAYIKAKAGTTRTIFAHRSKAMKICFAQYLYIYSGMKLGYGSTLGMQFFVAPKFRLQIVLDQLAS